MIALILKSTLLAWLLATTAVQPTVPPGHPAVPERPQPADVDRATANPADVQSPDAIILAYYDSISGAVTVKRDWNRFRSLFLPDARFATSLPRGETSVAIALSVDQFIKQNRAYFERGGYFEREVGRVEDSFGVIAHAYSTYASRRRSTDPEPYARGVNSFQLLNAADRWWIVSITWDRERPEGAQIPERFLAKPPQDEH